MSIPFLVEGKRFDVRPAVVKMSVTLDEMLIDFGDQVSGGEAIPLDGTLKVSSGIFEWLDMFMHDFPEATKANQKDYKRRLGESASLYAFFDRFSNDEMSEMLRQSDFLNIPILLYAIFYHVSNPIRKIVQEGGKNVNQRIADMLGFDRFPKDEEEKKARLERAKFAHSLFSDKDYIPYPHNPEEIEADNHPKQESTDPAVQLFKFVCQNTTRELRMEIIKCAVLPELMS